jgi:predicted CoA-binding protein
MSLRCQRHCPPRSSNPLSVFNWYTQHSLPVTPINPSAPIIKVGNKEYPTLPNLSALPHPTETSVSIITPPKVTIKVLEEAKELGIQGVWLQPGTFDDDVLGYAMREFKFAVGGDGGMGGEGWCVLVDGERAGRAAGLKL